MKVGRRFSDLRLSLLLAVGLLNGCAVCPKKLNQELMAHRGPPPHTGSVAESYRVSCPDVLEVTIPGLPAGKHPVGADGRIDLGRLGRPRVEGQTLDEAAQTIAEEVDVPASRVQVKVAEFRSQQILVFGEVNGLQRAVPYRGQETLLDLLQRSGGITKVAAPNDVYVVRSRLAEGRQPEIFHIELQEIVEGKDDHTNIRLQPLDQVYVGETGQSRVDKCVPPCMKPLYHCLCGLCRRRKGPSDEAEPQTVPAARPSPAPSEPPPTQLPPPRRLDQ